MPIGYTHGQDVVAHHAANAAAVAIPVGAVVVDHIDKPETAFTLLGLTLSAPEWVALVAGILGILWYTILIGEKIAGWYDKWEQRDVPEDPHDLVEGSHVQHPPQAN